MIFLFWLVLQVAEIERTGWVSQVPSSTRLPRYEFPFHSYMTCHTRVPNEGIHLANLSSPSCHLCAHIPGIAIIVVSLRPRVLRPRPGYIDVSGVLGLWLPNYRVPGSHQPCTCFDSILWDVSPDCLNVHPWVPLPLARPAGAPISSPNADETDGLRTVCIPGYPVPGTPVHVSGCLFVFG